MPRRPRAVDRTHPQAQHAARGHGPVGAGRANCLESARLTRADLVVRTENDLLKLRFVRRTALA